MLAMIPRELLLTILILILLIFGLTVLVGIAAIICAFIKAKKNGNYKQLTYNSVCLLCVVIMVAAWITNLGWIRFIMTLMAIPFAHAIIFMIINFFAASQIERSARLKILTILSYITYVVAYVFLPDGGDVGPMYVFFGLVHNHMAVYASEVISTLGFAGNIIVLIIQIIEIIILKRNGKETHHVSKRDEF